MKIQFDLTATYEINVNADVSKEEATDYVYANAVELISNGKAKIVGGTITNVIVK